MDLGDVVLLDFPFSDATGSKTRPALLLATLPGKHDDVVVCMISSRLTQAVEEFDEVILVDDDDFHLSGLKRSSFIRIGRLHVAESVLVLGRLRKLSAEAFSRVRERLSLWLAPPASPTNEADVEESETDDREVTDSNG